MAFCSACGTQMADGAAFCPKCGKASGQGAGAGAAPASAPAPLVTSGPTVSADPIAENVAGMLAYFTFIPAIIFLLIEPYNRNRFVRFHSFQCLFLYGALIVLNVALAILSAILHLVPVLGWLISAVLWPLYGLAVLLLWILLVVKAYQHQMFKLPIIGDIAEKQAGS